MTHETVPVNRRVYLIVKPGDAGRKVLQLSFLPPAVDGVEAALILRGMIMDSSVLDVDLVSDPSQDPDLKGNPGDEGPNGWTPVLVPVADGTRTAIKVADWVRSAGKPSIGFLAAGGALVPAIADAFNFNSIKRVDMFGGTTGSGGIATIAFDPPFSAVPAKALPSAVPNVLSGPVKAEIVAGTLTKSGCQVRVTAAALLTGVVAALTGASVNVIAIEA